MSVGRLKAAEGFGFLVLRHAPLFLHFLFAQGAGLKAFQELDQPVQLPGQIPGLRLHHFAAAGHERVRAFAE